MMTVAAATDVEASTSMTMMMTAPSAPQWILIVCFIVITIQLIRISMGLIQFVSIIASQQANTTIPSTSTGTLDVGGSNTITSNKTNGRSTSNSSDGTTIIPAMKTYTNYGSTLTSTTSTITKEPTLSNGKNENNTTNDEETMLRQPLVTASSSSSLVTNSIMKAETKNWHKWMSLFCISIWCTMAIVYVLPHFYIIFLNHPSIMTTANYPTVIHLDYPIPLLYTSSVTLVLEIVLFLGDDVSLSRYGVVQRTLHLTVPFLLWIMYFTMMDWNNHSTSSSWINLSLFGLTTCYVVFTIGFGYVTKHFIQISRTIVDPNQKDEGDGGISKTSSTTSTKKKKLSWSAIAILVKPYIWPDAVLGGTNSWETSINRFRALATWMCVIISKYCSLVSPLYLGWASTALAHQDYRNCIRYTIWYNVISWLSSTFKEGQSLMYLKVKQAAFIQLSQTAFGHLHTLSLDWHLRKKLGEVLRSMDRGISACDTLMNYLFLWLVPAIAECIIVCIIFATYFQYLPLGVTVFYFVFVYVVWTIVLTVWRKKFRKALVFHDNEWHDRFTDSMINFETVKFFTAEHYEMERFASAVRKYQAGSVDVQSSLSMLNISQQVILKACLATALSLAAIGIQKRIDCCVETMGCETGVSECCLSVSQKVCPGMQVGDFVAVLTYTLSLFAPLNFLGSVYNSIIMAMVDLGSMSELLAESPDVTDAPDAITLPPTNASNPDVAIEFDNVVFNYPTQPKERGLKGLSFTIKRGTTTAIVGPTGAGKTTVSRLLFRFYDVLGGAVKVNGIDVRSLSQHSLRAAIGVVPQAASMFNDTIRSNILYGRQDATEEELMQAATDAQLVGFIESLDEGWETLVGDRGLKLSGGEKQRAAIARCLLKNPPFILLDEATASLDTLTENSVQVALDRLGAQRTVLVIAHRLGTIRNADKIIVLKDGRAYEEGTHDELLLKNGLYADMWNMQLHSTSTTTSQSNLLSV